MISYLKIPKPLVRTSTGSLALRGKESTHLAVDPLRLKKGQSVTLRP